MHGNIDNHTEPLDDAPDISPEELAAEESRWRAEGRPLVGQAVQAHAAAVPAPAAHELPSTWTVIHVLNRLQEAYEVLARLPMSTRPRGHANSMPVYSYERADLVAQVETGELERMARTRNQYRPRGATSAEVARMEQALGWAADYLKDKPEVARAIQLGALWAATGADGGRQCRLLGIKRRAFVRRQMHGLTIITIELVRRRVPVT